MSNHSLKLDDTSRPQDSAWSGKPFCLNGTLPNELMLELFSATRSLRDGLAFKATRETWIFMLCASILVAVSGCGASLKAASSESRQNVLQKENSRPEREEDILVPAEEVHALWISMLRKAQIKIVITVDLPASVSLVLLKGKVSTLDYLAAPGEDIANTLLGNKEKSEIRKMTQLTRKNIYRKFESDWIDVEAKAIYSIMLDNTAELFSNRKKSDAGINIRIFTR